jgi:tetratricopeptide (TPR) repeat protein
VASLRVVIGVRGGVTALALTSSLLATTALAQQELSPSQVLQIVRATPSDAEASFELARIAAAQGDFATAIAALERVLIINPTLDNIRLELGVLYLRVGATAAAEELIRAALRSPNAPPEVRAQAEELLAAAEESNRRLRYAGSVTLGVIADSNANSGPAAETFGPGLSITEATGEADASAFVSANAQVRYDLGLQAGHLLALDTSLYGRRYQDLEDLDQLSFSIAAGADLNLSRALDRPADLLLRYNLNNLRQDGEPFLRETGPSATLRVAVDEQAEIQVLVSSFDQNYLPTVEQPRNDDRDGRRSSLELGYSRALSPNSSLTFGAGLSRKTAEVGYEAYDEVFVSAGYQRALDVPAIQTGPVFLGLNLQHSWRDYDEPDPAVARFGVSGAQSDRVWSVSASATVPLTERASFLAEVGHVSQDSNYPLDTFDNTYGLLAVTIAF